MLKTNNTYIIQMGLLAGVFAVFSAPEEMLLRDRPCIYSWLCRLSSSAAATDSISNYLPWWERVQVEEWRTSCVTLKCFYVHAYWKCTPVYMHFCCSISQLAACQLLTKPQQKPIIYSLWLNKIYANQYTALRYIFFPTVFVIGLVVYEPK